MHNYINHSFIYYYLVFETFNVYDFVSHLLIKMDCKSQENMKILVTSFVLGFSAANHYFPVFMQ